MSTPSSSNWWTAVSLPENVRLALKQVREDRSTHMDQTLFLDRVKQRRLRLAEGIEKTKAGVRSLTNYAPSGSDKAGWATALEEFRVEKARLVSEAKSWDEWWWEYGQHGEAYLEEASWLESEYLGQLQGGMDFADIREALEQREIKQWAAAMCSACRENDPCRRHLWPAETPTIDEAVILALSQDPNYLRWAAENPHPWDSKLD